ncbi:hypothetical protein Q427_08790 [Halomonas sp. BC04]|nr:hypothetical protein Q427_08790 [Halomonas sp. BC04]
MDSQKDAVSESHQRATSTIKQVLLEANHRYSMFQIKAF